MIFRQNSRSIAVIVIHEETPYEIMHKLERMQYLINNYPEIPKFQGGRMVDRLAKKYNLSKSTVG